MTNVKSATAATIIGVGLLFGLGSGIAAAETGSGNCTVSSEAAAEVRCLDKAVPNTTAPVFTGKNPWGDAVAKFARAHTWLELKWAANGGKKN